MELVTTIWRKILALSYLYVIEPTDTGYSAFIPDVSGVFAAGDTEDEVRKLLSDALCLHFLELIEDNEDIPSVTTMKYNAGQELGEYTTGFVTPSAPDKVSMEVENLVERSGLKYAEVARRMNVSRSIVSRLTNPVYRGHSMESLRKLAHSLGYEVEVSFKHIG